MEMSGPMNMYDIAGLDGVKKSDTIPGCVVNMYIEVTTNDKGIAGRKEVLNEGKKLFKKVSEHDPGGRYKQATEKHF